MALSLSASIYGKDGNDWNKVAGVIKGFPTSSIIISALSPAVSYSGVACNTVITLLPTGLNISKGNEAGNYYTPTATATVITAANA